MADDFEGAVVSPGALRYDDTFRVKARGAPQLGLGGERSDPRHAFASFDVWRGEIGRLSAFRRFEREPLLTGERGGDLVLDAGSARGFALLLGTGPVDDSVAGDRPVRDVSGHGAVDQQRAGTARFVRVDGARVHVAVSGEDPGNRPRTGAGSGFRNGRERGIRGSAAAGERTSADREGGCAHRGPQS